MRFTERLNALREKHPTASRKVLFMSVRYQMGIETLDWMTLHHVFPQPCYGHYEAKPLLTFEESRTILREICCN